MRLLVSFAVILAASSLLLWRYPEVAKRGYQEITEKSDQFLTEKQIDISGLTVLGRSDIVKDLPLSKSVSWWHLHHREIESGLERNVLIQKAVVKRCETFSVRCFEISIQEREPAFITTLNDTVWLIGNDGGFITPVPKKQFEEKGANVVMGRKPIVVEGLLSDSVSPDAAKARIQYVKAMIAAVEPETGLKVVWVDLRKNGETALRFSGFGFEAIFDVSGSDLVKVREEAQRLKTVLNQFGDRVSDIARVDLAFDKVAVAKLKS